MEKKLTAFKSHEEFLYRIHPEPQVRNGCLLGVSPSGKYANVDGGSQWHPVQSIIIVEMLEEPTPASSNFEMLQANTAEPAASAVPAIPGTIPANN